MSQALIRIFQGIRSLLRLQTVTITSTYTVDSGTYPDCVILCNLSAAKTVTLPAPTLGRILLLKDIAGNAATNHITISAASGNVEGASTYAISDNNGGVLLASDGTNFWVLAGYTGTVI